MKVSVERLRWGLAAAVVALLAGLFGLVTYGRYAAAKKWKDILARNGVKITRESDNVTWSQSVKGRTVFTIRAKKAIPIADGKYTLRGVTLLLYGKTSDRVDRVEGDEFEYDEKAGVAKAIGEVHMDVQAPGALTHRRPAGQTPAAGAGGGEPDGENVIHVLTSGLVYLRKLGVAATDQRVEFHYAGLTCVSRGAEFETGGNALHLLADVEMTGILRGQPATVHAARADLDRDRNTIAVLQPVASTTTRSGRKSGTAVNALLLLHPDGSLQHANAWGSVRLETPLRHVAAQRMEATFAAQSVPASAVLTGDVTLDGSAAKPMHGTAAEADLSFNSAGAVSGVLGKGGVRLTASSTVRAGTPALARELRGEQVSAKFRTSGSGKQSSLQEVHVVGGAFARGESFATVKPGGKSTAAPASGVATTQVSGEELLAAFVPPAGGDKQASLQRLTGRGHTQLEQIGLNGAQESSSADTLDAVFAPNRRSPGESPRLQSALQTGHVQIRDQAATQGGKRGALSLAHGDRAAFDAATDRLTLTGGAGYQQEGTSLSADAVSVEQASGNAEAQGHVEASLAGADREATHVQADRARLMRSAQTAEFFGTDALPARMWQGGSQVMAANLFLDDARQSLTARPAAAGALVEAVFAAETRAGVSPDRGGGTPALPRAKAGRAAVAGDGTGTGGAPAAVHVSSPAITYSGLRHEVVCTGGVRLRQGEMQARAQQAVVFLSGGSATPDRAGRTATGSTEAGSKSAGLGSGGELGGSLERMVLSGAVRLDEAGRAGDGEQLVYTARDGSYLLTGTPARPPRVADAEQGLVTGPALLLRSGEKSVIVTGTAASNAHEMGGSAAGTGRVHTDVAVRPQQR